MTKRIEVPTGEQVFRKLRKKTGEITNDSRILSLILLPTFLASATATGLYMTHSFPLGNNAQSSSNPDEHPTHPVIDSTHNNAIIEAQTNSTASFLTNAAFNNLAERPTINGLKEGLIVWDKVLNQFFPIQNNRQ